MCPSTRDGWALSDRLSGLKTVTDFLVLTQHYRPEPNFITADVAEMLARVTRVTVLTAHPNYPHGRFYSGTPWWRPSRRVENGVTVWRLPIFPDHSRSPMRRGLSYLSFLIAATLVAPWIGGRPRVVWVYQTPFTTALAALWFKVVWGTRLIYTCADLWPESFVAAGVMREGMATRVSLALRRWINRLADVIICSTRGTLHRFASEGIPESRLHMIPVWVEGSEQRQPAPAEEGRTIVYAGNLGPAQQLDTLVRAAALLAGEGDRVQFAIYGSGRDEDELRALADELGAANLTFYGRVSPREAFEASANAMAQVVSLRGSPLFSMTVPSKLQFCMAAASPILYGLEGEAAELARASGGGVAFESGSVPSLVGAIRKLAALPASERAQMRRALRRYYERHFARGELLARYRELLGRDASPALDGEQNPTAVAP